MKTVYFDTNIRRAQGIMQAMEIIGRDCVERIEFIFYAYRMPELAARYRKLLIICADRLEDGITAAELASAAKDINRRGRRPDSEVWFFTYGAERQPGNDIDGHIPAHTKDCKLRHDIKNRFSTELSPILLMLTMDWEGKSLIHVASLIPEVEILRKDVSRA